MGEFSISHVLIFTLILLIFFGPSRLPALGQSIGKAIRGFKEGMNEAQNEMNKSVYEQPPQQNQQTQNTPTQDQQISQQGQDSFSQKTEDKTRQNNS